MKNKIGFLENGQEVEILGNFGDKFVVKGTGKIINMNELGEYEYECDNYLFVQEEQIVEKVYDNILETESIKKFNTILNDINNQIINKRKEFENIKKDMEGFLEKFNKFEGLSNLEKFINREHPTHYLIIKDSYEIVEFEKFTECYGHKTPKILSLHFKEVFNKPLQFEWKTHDYNDFSGSNQNVIPCFSLQEAKEQLQKHINYKINNETRYFLDIKGLKQKFPFLVFPKDYIDKYKEEKQKYILKNIEDRKSEINRYENELKSYIDIK